MRKRRPRGASSLLALLVIAASAGSDARAAGTVRLDADMPVAQQSATQPDDAAPQRAARAAYQRAIYEAIVRHWSRRRVVTGEARCDVSLEQDSHGKVIAVETRDCTGSDAFRQSVETAVWRASPLPLPGDPTLFRRHLRFTLRAK